MSDIYGNIPAKLTIYRQSADNIHMAKKSQTLFKKNLLSRSLIGLTLVLILTASFEAVTQNDFTTLAPTQLFVVAGVFGILGLYTKD